MSVIQYHSKGLAAVVFITHDQLGEGKKKSGHTSSAGLEFIQTLCVKFNDSMIRLRSSSEFIKTPVSNLMIQLPSLLEFIRSVYQNSFRP